MAKKEKSTFITPLGHLLAVVCIVLVFVFGSLPFLAYSPYDYDYFNASFYDILTDDVIWFRGGLAIVIILGIVGVLTVAAALVELLNRKKKSSLYCYVLGALLAVVAVLIFSGYEMLFAQLTEEFGGGEIGTAASNYVKEFFVPGTGYYLMGIAASVGAGVEILTGLLG